MVSLEQRLLQFRTTIGGPFMGDEKGEIAGANIDLPEMPIKSVSQMSRLSMVLDRLKLTWAI